MEVVGMTGVVISLCDLTGHMVQPWVEDGYTAVLVDPQHGTTTQDGPVLRIADTIQGAFPILSDIVRGGQVAFVAGFPPCTDMAVSGARWFERKRRADPMFQARAVSVAEQCRTIGEMSGAPYLVENPVSVLSRVFGRPDHTFDPCDYTALEPADNYHKKTCLWTGGGFVMPPPQRDLTLGEPDHRIHRMSPGPERANLRSATPSGFARAVHMANRSRVEVTA